MCGGAIADLIQRQKLLQKNWQTSNYFLFSNWDSKVDKFFNLIFQSILKMSSMYLMSTSYDISDIVGFEKKV